MDKQLTSKHIAFIKKMIKLYESGEHFISLEDFKFLAQFYNYGIGVYDKSMEVRLNVIRGTYLKYKRSMDGAYTPTPTSIIANALAGGVLSKQQILQRVKSRQSPGILTQEQHKRIRGW
jgi:hypothetical protein